MDRPNHHCEIEAGPRMAGVIILDEQNVTHFTHVSCPDAGLRYIKYLFIVIPKDRVRTIRMLIDYTQAIEL